MKGVYILIDKTCNLIKIGKTMNLKQRLSSFKYNPNYFFDLEQSYFIETRYRSRVENTLHFICDDFHHPHLSKSDGYSEFFNIECLDQLLSFIQEHEHKFHRFSKINNFLESSTRALSLIESRNKNSDNLNRILRHKASFLKHLFKLHDQDILNVRYRDCTDSLALYDYYLITIKIYPDYAETICRLKSFFYLYVSRLNDPSLGSHTGYKFFTSLFDFAGFSLSDPILVFSIHKIHDSNFYMKVMNPIFKKLDDLISS
ncbi:GIY-YIG nuclease family protein [Sulfurovum mangrovi]|uniref:GIY-YIG nuclease family protein n=1 Tax=Sulfurovum mangrovi TaxID=2893889 RepID=UPI001E5C02B2|nr:GIY-YIG nuclease family protein [Sulfurovum mangrovi]UFH60032.1 GIY-YIG nuclease family protein [Sulfurovum mangrovi]